MKFWWIWIWIGVVVVLGVVCVRSASLSLPKDPFFGIAPEDEKYYKTSSDTIKCKDGSDKFTKSQLNDDFCDCPDGTDEPGTSACPTGKFYCRNAGHTPLLLYSSRVNDGICDCCDGSDEYDGKVKCPNTCWESGKMARDKLKTKIATYQEGVALRKQEVEQAKLAVAKDEAELSQLRSEEKILKGLVQQLKERKEQIEKAEERERLQKEEEVEKERLQKEKEEKKEAEEATEKKNKPEDEAKEEESKADEKADNVGQPTGSAHDDKIGLLGDSPSDQDAMDYQDSAAKVEHSDTSRNEGSSSSRVEQYAVEDKEETILPESKESAVVSETGLGDGSEVSPDEVLEVRNDVSENTEDLSREELGRLVASRWTGEKAGKQTEEVDGVKDNDEGHERTPEYTHDEEYDGYASETDEDNHKYDNDIEDEVEEDIGEEDHDDASYSYKAESDDDESELSDITTPSNPSWLEKIQHTVRNILQAVNLFQTPVDQSEATRVRKEYEESSTRLSKIQSRISSLTQKLKHDFGPEKEFYSFYGRCFEAKQNKYVYKVCPFKQASQEEGHSTTRLGNWDKFGDSYKVMLFSNGDKCWNGPDRSMKVKLRCGLKNEVADVDEPSRCEYVALLSTPSLCVEEKLKELQDKLDMMKKEQPQSHDEL